MKDDEIFKKIKELEKIHESKTGIENDVLGIHEASTKLWQSLNKTEEEKQRRLANIFIGAYTAASRLGVLDIPKIIEARLEELTDQMKK